MNAIESLLKWNEEIAVKVESHVSLIERVNRERLQTIEARDTALASKDFETHDKLSLELASSYRVLARFGLELVALLKADAQPEAATQPIPSPTDDSKPEALTDDSKPDAPIFEGDVVRFRDDAQARAYLGLPPARDPATPSFPKMLALFERLAREEEIL